MAYFTFKGTDSRSMGLQIIQMPLPEKSACSVKDITIPGRNTQLHRHTSERGCTDKTIIVEITSSADPHAIFAWLDGDAGDLILSDTPDRKYTAYVCGAVPGSRINPSYRSLSITFRCDPFAYAIANTPLICATSPAIFQTIGTIYSEPVITVTGSGEITLTVNGVALRITGVTGNVTIDVPRRLAYYTDGNGKKTACLDHTYGNLWDMLLVPDPDAFNRVSWTGNATQVEITKNERWL